MHIKLTAIIHFDSLAINITATTAAVVVVVAVDTMVIGKIKLYNNAMQFVLFCLSIATNTPAFTVVDLASVFLFFLGALFFISTFFPVDHL